MIAAAVTRSRAACGVLVFFLFLGETAAGAGPASLDATAELTYGNYRATTSDNKGTMNHSEGRDFSQTYSLDLHLMPVPTIRLDASGQFLKDESALLFGDSTARVQSTTVRPSVELQFTDPFRVYSAGAGYSEMVTQNRSAAAWTEYHSDEYHVRLGYRPEAFPSVAMLFSRTNNYDALRASTDLTTDLLTLTTRYSPTPRLGVSYGITATDTRDKLSEMETNEVRQSLSANYAEQFLNNRSSFTSNANLGLQTTELSQPGPGTSFTLQLFPAAALSNVTDTPLSDTLASNGALIDGNLVTPTSLNIGSSLPLAGDTKLREMAVDLYTPQPVDTVRIWVDKQLPSDIAGSFVWEVYTSSDNSAWVLQQTIGAAPFSPFQNRFSLAIQPASARYLKVAVRPLSPAVNGAAGPAYQNLFITEMQVFTTSSAAQLAQSTTRQMSQFYSAGLRTRLLDSPMLYHDINLTASLTDMPGGTRSSLDVTNGLSVNRKFNPVYTGSARLAMENKFGHGAGDSATTFTYNAALSATPLPTLNGSLMYNGGRTTGDRKSETNSLFLSTAARLYRGIDVNMSGGVSNGRSESAGTTVATETILFSAGSALAPRRDLNMSLLYSSSRTNSSGGPQAPVQQMDRWSMDVVYRPFTILYFTAGWEARSDWQPHLTQHYSVVGAPFLAGGDLQISLVYSENYNSDNRTLQKIMGPTLEWRLTPRSTLSSAYQAIRSESSIGRSDIDNFTFTFRLQL